MFTLTNSAPALAYPSNAADERYFCTISHFPNDTSTECPRRCPEAEPSAGMPDTAAARLAAGSQVVLLRGGAPVVSALREDYALGHDRFEDVSELHRRCPAGGVHGSGRVKVDDA